MNNRIHRPPTSIFEIRELIKLARYDEAADKAQKNADFYAERETEALGLITEAMQQKLN